MTFQDQVNQYRSNVLQSTFAELNQSQEDRDINKALGKLAVATVDTKVDAIVDELQERLSKLEAENVDGKNNRKISSLNKRIDKLEA